MMGEGIFSRLIISILLISCVSCSYGQIIHSGEIIFTRRTNLEKKYKGVERFNTRRFKEMLKKPVFDKYVLYFNDTSCLFKPIPPNVGEGDREFFTVKTTTYQNLNSGKIRRQFSFFGSSIFMKDSLKKRQWIITGSTREIAGYKTHQALWKANDSVHIYAWYSKKIAPPVGPETFNGLPGAILGLAIEDGGVVYFAEEVKPLPEEDKDFKKKMPKGKKKEYYTKEALKKFLLDRFQTEETSVGASRSLYDFYYW